jgi:tetratricopeptide (TPR) repeat protein
MQHKSYEEIIDAANDARIATNDNEAIKLYREALAIGGSRDTEAHWMLGVSLINTDKHQEALEEFEFVLADCSDGERANVLRDKARALTRLKRYEEADKAIAESLKLLEASGDKSEYGATVGFAARLKLDQGKTAEALEEFKQADELLKAADNRHFELYNKMHYAEALSEYGDKKEAERVLTEAEALIPQYGGEKHGKRAEDLRSKIAILVLLVGVAGTALTGLGVQGHTATPTQQQAHQQSQV